MIIYVCIFNTQSIEKLSNFKAITNTLNIQELYPKHENIIILYLYFCKKIIIIKKKIIIANSEMSF